MDHGAGEVTFEQAAPQARDAGEPRVDIVVAGANGRTDRLDVAITHCLNKEAMRNGRAAREDGTAATMYEAHKRAVYPGIRLTPAIVETHGRLGTALLAYVRKAYAGLDDEARSLAIRETYATLATTVQRANADTLLAAQAAACQPNP